MGHMNLNSQLFILKEGSEILEMASRLHVHKVQTLCFVLLVVFTTEENDELSNNAKHTLVQSDNVRLGSLSALFRPGPDVLRTGNLETCSQQENDGFRNKSKCSYIP